MFDKVSRLFLGVAFLAVLAGCNKTDSAGALDSASDTAAAAPAVIQGSCPQIIVREGTAVYQTFEGGAKGDPTKLTYQASLADTTRQCVLSNEQLVITVVAQGRVLAGPNGSAGTVNLPIRIAVNDGTSTLYSELTQHPVEIPADGLSNQFVFTKTNVTIPGGAGSDAKIYIGFDEGPPKKAQ